MSLDTAVQTLVKRLETVTARLEQVEKQLASGSASGSLPASSSSGAGESGSSASVSEYEALISSHITPLVQLVQEIGSDELKQQVSLLEKAVQTQRDFLSVAAASKKPDQAGLQTLVGPTSALIQQIQELREKQRKSKQFNHLSTISEGIPALGWVVVEPTPAPFVNEARSSSEFYSNKILVEFKKTDPKQVQFVTNFNEFLKDLNAYVKKNHTTGLTWNPRGGDASSAKATPSAPSAGGAPPPPAGVPPPASAGSEKPAPNTGGLFAALNKGADITSGLKKVTKEMKTKNQDKSALSPVVAPKSEGAAKAPKAAGAVKKGTPKFELAGNKWVVEWQENNQNIEIKETEVKQTVYIYKCEKAVIRITGKINAITIDSCKRTAVIFEDAVSSVELVNSTSCEVQCTGRVPSMAVDKCSGVQLFVSPKGLDVEIVSSKSDSMNVLIPDPAGGVDPVEIAIPEQFKTTIANGKLITGSVEHV